MKRTVLHSSLPGKNVQERMAPRPKIIEGIEGNHSGPPVESAVLILIIPYRNELAVTFIKRANRGRYHGGQMAFPGGKCEPEDKNAVETALRECREEIGICPDDIYILGNLSKLYIPLSNYNITPIVGTLLKTPEFNICEEEVESVIPISLTDLFHPQNKTDHHMIRHEQEIVTPGYQIGETFIWGATAMIISEMEHIMKNNLLKIRIEEKPSP